MELDEGKRQFTVLGHPVNMAARYETATKELQAPLVIGETFARLEARPWLDRAEAAVAERRAEVPA